MGSDNTIVNNNLKETRVLILGATGMLGHKILQLLSKNFQVWGTVRGETGLFKSSPIFSRATLIGNIKAESASDIEWVMDQAKPDWVINCIGVINEPVSAKDHVEAIQINSLLPHQLAKACIEAGTHLVHFSTDCVFSGGQGNYSETDPPRPVDSYGLSKLLGEVSGPGCFTLRTSIVGRELRKKNSLIEWVLSQRGKSVRGYSRAIYSGLTTNAVADLVLNVIQNFPELDGIWHVSSNAISKYELLKIVNEVYDLGMNILEDAEFVCDRSLDGSRFFMRTNIQIQDWRKMIVDMHDDKTSYGEAVAAIKGL